MIMIILMLIILFVTQFGADLLSVILRVPNYFLMWTMYHIGNFLVEILMVINLWKVSGKDSQISTSTESIVDVYADTDSLVSSERDNTLYESQSNFSKMCESLIETDRTGA